MSSLVDADPSNCTGKHCGDGSVAEAIAGVHGCAKADPKIKEAPIARSEFLKELKLIFIKIDFLCE